MNRSCRYPLEKLEREFNPKLINSPSADGNNKQVHRIQR